MNDYKFGNFICDRREQLGLTQSQLAGLLGLSAKAVSKWENGRSMPTVKTMRRLASLFGVSVEELLQMREEEKQVELTRIVITGGPSAGKTTGMSWIQNNLTKRGYTVLFVPETATELITGGVAPWTCGSNTDFQRSLLQLQMEKERVFERAARTMNAEKVLVVCDRGAMDNKAYMTEAEFTALLSEVGCSEVQLRDSYDAVFHLVTAAKGDGRFYTTENNAARTETAEEAAALDDRIIAAWAGHPHLRIIDNAEDFSVKMRKLLAEINAFLGEPEPYEIERKYLVSYPDLSWLESLPSCRRVEIIQTYLRSDDDCEIRVRQRGERGNYIYTRTKKRSISGVKRLEIEQRLSQEEYVRCLMEADPNKRPIRKTRYCLIYENQYFELDLYPFWQDRAVLEIELSDADAEIRFPPELNILREVTEDESYKNASLAAVSTHPDEMKI